MKRFAFSLEQILRLREYEERQAELELGRVTGECERLRREIGSLGDLSRVAARSHLGSRSFDVSYRFGEERYILRLRSRSEQLSRELLEWERELEKARSRYREARKQREVLSRLKSRKAEHHQEEVKKERQLVLDEVSALIWRREKNG
ncbi:MAG: flagellar export protein FliJ [Spirochaetaceae bacterium]